MLKNNNFLFGYVQICEDYDMKTNSILNLVSNVNFNKMNKFNIYLSCRISGEQSYKIFLIFSSKDKFLIADQFDIPSEEIFLIFSSKDKFLIADQFDIPSEEIEEDVSIIEYNKVYKFVEKNFPEKGVYCCELYAIPTDKYLAQQDSIEKNGNQELYDYLQMDDENLLYKTYFNIE